ncbi:MAG TPA: helix-turn-helix transcriptional regulator [Flavisolibacter sp.]|jgi:AraC-like DNA-binding protein|nr:helix-turn-helix transcriptional regulator [Flavisolibacter sp.]
MKTIPVRQIASAQTLQSSAGRFSIRNLQQVLNGKDLVHDLHKHDFYFVLAVQDGGGMHEIDFVQYPVHNLSVFILRPGQVHRLELTADTTGFLMEFDLSFYQPKSTIKEHRWKKASSKNYCEVEAARFSRLLAHLAAIFDEHSEKQEGYSEAIRAYLDLFFIEYIRQSRYPSSIVQSASGYMQERFEEFVRLLETNIVSMKNVSQYADLLSLSSYQLNAITKASVGKTVSDLIDAQIILEAKRYLLATPNQVKEIADHLGYEDPSYFIRYFKKHTGQSPDAFRKNFK